MLHAGTFALRVEFSFGTGEPIERDVFQQTPSSPFRSCCDVVLTPDAPASWALGPALTPLAHSRRKSWRDLLLHPTRLDSPACILVLQTTRDKSINYVSLDGPSRLVEGTRGTRGKSCHHVECVVELLCDGFF